jgi:hypothetical protein
LGTPSKRMNHPNAGRGAMARSPERGGHRHGQRRPSLIESRQDSNPNLLIRHRMGLRDRAFPEPRPATVMNHCASITFVSIPGRRAAETNEPVTAMEAAEMGRLVDRLHRLALPAPALARRTGFGPDHWRRLAAAGCGCGANWAEAPTRRSSPGSSHHAALRRGHDLGGVKGVGGRLAPGPWGVAPIPAARAWAASSTGAHATDMTVHPHLSVDLGSAWGRDAGPRGP